MPQFLRPAICATLLVLCYCTELSAQTDTATQPSITYAPPLRGQLLVTGTFGELRSNHFHAGLDFRASVNTPVYAVADGYVSRIMISPGGYGQAVYVDHPDGNRSVYAHLETLAPALLDTVRARQFAETSFPQTLTFPPSAFPVSQGDALGGVGNRGHSFGPHLHFEIRTVAEDAPMNPLALGFDVADNRTPQIRNLRVYGLNDQGLETSTQTLAPRRLKAGTYIIPDTIVLPTNRAGLALKTYDRQDGMPNWNGIYGGSLFADTTEIFSFSWDTIPYAQTEYLNALTDYADWKANTSWYHRFWALTQDAMFWRKAGEVTFDGSLRLRPNLPFPVRMEVRDFAGNTSTLSFTLVYQPQAENPTTPSHQYFLPAGEASIIDNGALRLELSDNALYRDCYFSFAQLADRSSGYWSDVFQLHEYTTPLHGRAKLALRPNAPVPDSLRNKLFVGQCSPSGRWSSYGGRWEADGRLHTSIGAFGDYAISIDTIPPKVEVHRFSTDLRQRAGFSVEMTDNVGGGGLTYRGTIDGEWVLLEYDVKNDRLNYAFADGDPGPGEHLFELEVRDARDNATIWRRKFRR